MISVIQWVMAILLSVSIAPAAAVVTTPAAPESVTPVEVATTTVPTTTTTVVEVCIAVWPTPVECGGEPIPVVTIEPWEMEQTK